MTAKSHEIGLLYAENNPIPFLKKIWKEVLDMKLATLTDSEIMMTLTALACLLAGAFIVGKLFEKIQAPKVVGEIIGGMLFGGTF